ncbi:MAG: MFS transporter [Desulfovibrio sp.]|jgi:putative MFS transporter|nr:MFS transporter [Desulfovibrio sp.]
MQDNAQQSPLTVDNIIEKLPVTRAHAIGTLICALGFMFDSFDTYIISYAMPVLRNEWSLDPVTAGTLNSAGIWGMFLGGVVCGPFTDRMGRRMGLICTILGFSLINGFAAVCTNVPQFLAVRFISGLCLGGMIPCAAALISELVNSKHRGRVTALLPTLWPMGMFVAAVVSSLYLPAFNEWKDWTGPEIFKTWRGLFIIGALPAFLAFFVFRYIQESPRWLISTGQKEKCAAVLKKLGASDQDLSRLTAPTGTEKQVGIPISVLFKPPYRKRMILTCGYYFFSYFGYYGFLLWLPSILTTVYGLKLSNALQMTIITGLVALLGRFVGLYTIERFGRKQLFIVGFGVAGFVAMSFCFMHNLFLTNPTYLLYLLCIVVFFYEQGIQGTVAYTPELYPSSVRTTAAGVSAGFGRASGALSSIVFGFFMSHQWYDGIYITMAIMFWIAALLVVFLGVETKGRTLEELGAA